MELQEDPPSFTAEQAIDFALDRLVPPMGEEFLRDWRDRRDLMPWVRIVRETETEFSA